MALQWNDLMTTGIKEVDDAHKTLILWVNKLNDAMKSGKAKEEVLNILAFLGKYATQHFSHEEGCMNQYNCPAAAANKKAHSDFLVYFTKMKTDVENNGVTTMTVVDLQNALSDWLKNHIMKIDTSLLPCVKQSKKV
jgi:hemerythrin